MKNGPLDVARQLLRRTPLYDVYIICRASGLREWGWFKSLRQRRPVDGQGRPLPWYTYPCTHFLERRVRPGMVVFEFGCGNSTLWWASRAATVKSVEHDPAWYAVVHAQLPSNVTLVLRPIRDGSYANEILADDRVYEVVVIDGRLRNCCAEICLARLSPTGVIIWDNTDRPQYRKGLRLLESRGFRRIDFVGLAPGLDLRTVTSVLYRSENCLGL